MNVIYVRIYLINIKESEANKPIINKLSIIKDSNWHPFEEKKNWCTWWWCFLLKGLALISKRWQIQLIQIGLDKMLHPWATKTKFKNVTLLDQQAEKDKVAETTAIWRFYTKLAGFYTYTSRNSMFWKLPPTCAILVQV